MAERKQLSSEQALRKIIGLLQYVKKPELVYLEAKIQAVLNQLD